MIHETVSDHQTCYNRYCPFRLDLGKQNDLKPTGTNIHSVSTPNGLAAFLFLPTSTLAPVIRLSYGRMVMLALPNAITMSLTGLAAVYHLL